MLRPGLFLPPGHQPSAPLPGVHTQAQGVNAASSKENSKTYSGSCASSGRQQTIPSAFHLKIGVIQLTILPPKPVLFLNYRR